MIKEERFSSISHMIGAAVALAGLVVLVVLAALEGDPWKIVSFSIYGTALFLLYTFSTLYHSFQGEAKRIFRKLDHLSIYILIAGTYTPFTLITLRGEWGWWIFGGVWSLGVLGIGLEFVPRERRVLSVIIYILMGWFIIVAIKPLLAVMPMMGFVLLLSGGLFYTVGIFFYALDKKFRHFHGIWHLFVLAGSVSHYLTMLLYVL